MAIAGIIAMSGLQAKAAPPDSTRKANMEAMKKKRKELYVQKLALTPAEAEKFFPVWDEFEQKMRESKKAFRTKWKGKKPEDLNEAEAAEFMQDAIKMRETEVQLFKTYTDKLKGTIPAKKLVLLPRVSREVQHELVKEMKEKRGKRGPGGPGKHGPRGPGGPGGPGGPLGPDDIDD